MNTELIHIGFGNVLAVNRVIAMVSPNSAPTKRMVQQGRDNGMLVDMTNGRRTKAVLIMDSGHIVLAAIAPETIAGRLQANRAESSTELIGSVLRIDQGDEKSSI